MIPVQVLQDDSSHWYIVPTEKAERFDELLELFEYMDSDDEEEHEKGRQAELEFDNYYAKYRTGGSANLYQLYISEENFQKLTNGK